jgi:Fe-S cluster biogenesis protein NfuA
MFIQTEATPNPATLKFLPGRVVMPEGTFDAQDEASAAPSPLATRLFSMPEVAGVYLGHDFISVTKREGEWQHLKPAILGAIMEHFLSGAPVVAAGAQIAGNPDEEFFDPADVETVDNIKELIETRVRPAVAGDGGDITFRGYKDGVVYLNMRGACSGCPSSTATLKHGIQNLLRHFVPEVREVEAIQA